MVRKTQKVFYSIRILWDLQEDVQFLIVCANLKKSHGFTVKFITNESQLYSAILERDCNRTDGCELNKNFFVNYLCASDDQNIYHQTAYKTHLIYCNFGPHQFKKWSLYQFKNAEIHIRPFSYLFFCGLIKIFSCFIFFNFTLESCKKLCGKLSRTWICFIK